MSISIDTNNSSGAGFQCQASNSYSFVGTSTDVTGHSSVQISVYSDQSGVAYIEHSHDPAGAGWTASTGYTVTASTHMHQSAYIRDKYMRVRFVLDGVVATTVCSVVTKLLSDAAIENYLDSTQDSVTAEQGGAPWAVTIPALSAASDSIEARLYDSAGNGILSTLNAAHVLESNSGLLLADTNSLVARTPVLGSAAMAASVPVTLASDQPDLPVTEARWNGWTQASVTTAVTVNAAASSLGRVHIYNSSGATAYVSFFDLASGSVVLGTTTPVLTFPVGNNSSLVFDARVVFSAEIAIASTTAHAGAVPSAAGVDVCVTYQ